MINHFILLKYKDDTPRAHLDEFCRKMYALREGISQIKELQIGLDVIHDQRSWDLILIMKFDSLADLKTYQAHPAHQAASRFNQDMVSQVASLDFEEPVPPH
ncbi:MAG TPA: Dabb family protein [Pseudomonadales bacterium]|nr:Dabb family protein [Pseudomonadales bacterium]